jgi:hypothetical protein
MVMKQTVALYVGADNQTGVLDLPRLENIVSKRHEGFTVISGKGYWMGKDEDTAMVIINDDRDAITETAHTLKTELMQDAIGMQVMPDMEFV